eukprot:Gb_19707 [translate_table: standard]
MCATRAMLPASIFVLLTIARLERATSNITRVGQENVYCSAPYSNAAANVTIEHAYFAHLTGTGIPNNNGEVDRQMKCPPGWIAPLTIPYASIQAQTATITDPNEVQMLRALAQKWNIDSSASWNLTDPCTGPAVDTTDIRDPAINPAIKCDCSFNNGSICHITRMKVYALDKTGELPEELANLTFLRDLNLAQNYLTGSLPAFLGNLTGMQYLSFSSNSLNGTLPPELGNLTLLQQLFHVNGVQIVMPLMYGKVCSFSGWMTVRLHCLHSDDSRASL